MAQTSNYGLGKPDPTTTVAEEIERLIATWDQLDMILKTLADAIATKAAANHNQAIGTITGLTEALAGKMAASKTFAVADLTDVSGSVEAALGYVLAKTAMGFSFQSAASLLGNHQHGVADIVGLTAAIDAKIAALVAASPATLDTLAELATALGNDPNFATTMAAQIADAARLTTGTVPDARLPARLRELCQYNVITDCDAATKAGVYSIESTGANKPTGEGGYIVTIPKQDNWLIQYFYRQTNDANSQAVWKRFIGGSAFGAWQRVYETAAEIQSIVPALGVGQTWQNVLSSRSAGTVYQNTSGKPIVVAMNGWARYSFCEGQVSADNVTWLTPPRPDKIASSDTTYYYAYPTFVVPLGHYYRLTQGSSFLGVLNWLELR